MAEKGVEEQVLAMERLHIYNKSDKPDSQAYRPPYFLSSIISSNASDNSFARSHCSDFGSE